MAQMKEMDAYIGIRASDNIAEFSDIPHAQLQLHNAMTSDVLNERVNNTKWVVLRYPNHSMAQLANTSLEQFEDFYFDVCNLDYAKMSRAMDALVELMNKTDKVHIVGPGTDLTFSIKDIPAIKCDGKCNIPELRHRQNKFLLRHIRVFGYRPNPSGLSNRCHWVHPRSSGLA